MRKFLGLLSVLLASSCQPVPAFAASPIIYRAGCAFNLLTSACIPVGGGVTSVFGRGGAVAAQVGDYAAFYLQKSNNLSDVANAATARTNLGLGSAATHAATDFQLQLATQTGAAHQFVNGFTSLGTFDFAQPDFSDLTGVATIAQGGTNTASYHGLSMVFVDAAGTHIVEDFPSFNYDPTAHSLSMFAGNAAIFDATNLSVFSQLYIGGPDGARFVQQVTPPAAPAGSDFCYTKSDDKFYCIGNGGVENLIGPQPAVPTEFVVTKTSAFTVTTANQILLGDATGGAFAFALPTAASSFVGGKSYVFTFTKIDSSANAVSIAATGADKITGDSSVSLTSQYDSTTLYTDGTNWYAR